jgi:hypothetical protein
VFLDSRSSLWNSLHVDITIPSISGVAPAQNESDGQRMGAMERRLGILDVEHCGFVMFLIDQLLSTALCRGQTERCCLGIRSSLCRALAIWCEMSIRDDCVQFCYIRVYVLKRRAFNRVEDRNGIYNTAFSAGAAVYKWC